MKRLRKSIGLARLWLVLAAGLAPACSGFAQGTIVYVQPSEPLRNVPSRELDLNGDGQIDCRFFVFSEGNFFLGTAASGVGSARLLVTPIGLYSLGSDLLGLTEGYLIGGSLNPTWVWASSDAPSRTGQARVLSVFFPDIVPPQVFPAGDYYAQTAFMGINFQIGSEWHYGWVRIRGGQFGDEPNLIPPSWILDWAYETRPDTPIFAGAVPEPSALALLVGGGMLLVWFRRGRNERRG
jgi:hypothetical protein